jgi:hypothetical protein
MSDWFRDITTTAWNPNKRRLSPARPESPAPAGLIAMPFHPPRRSDDPPDGNVWTLRNGERLDTPERFFDWLECLYRDDVEAREPGASTGSWSAVAPSR